MSDPRHVEFLGDRQRAFVLPPLLIVELERKTGIGIGALCRRLFRGDFHHADVVETIRLALIGGGEDPADAAALVRVYVEPRPIAVNMALAVAILERAYFGAPQEDAA